MSERVLIIGNGGYGTALAMALAGSGHRVTLWGWRPDYAREMAASRRNPHFLPDIDIPPAIDVIGRGDALPPADIVLAATPTQYLRGVFGEIGRALPPGTPIVSVAKGIENKTLLRPSEIIGDVLKSPVSVAVLSGPSHAEEVARGLPTTVVAAAADPDLGARVQTLFNSETFRVYTQDDVTGVELGAATKNVIAIATGCARGLGLGDNAQAALMTRGLHEMARLGVALGGRRETFAGLTGMGDLIVTCTSAHSRNGRLGEALGRGATLEEIQAGTLKVAEGVATTRSLVGLSDRHGIELPITRQVHRILFEGTPAREAVGALMTRGPRSEVESFQ